MIPLFAAPTIEEVPLGLEGDACEARVDCQPELRCLQHVCRGERQGEPAQGRDPEPEKQPFEFVGTHPFFAITTGGGLAFGVQQTRFGMSSYGFGVFTGALHAGVSVDRIAFEVELTPASEVLGGQGTLAVFHANAAIGYLTPIGRNITWPFRLGVGAGFIPAPSVGLFELRADALDLLMTAPVGSGAVMIETHFPSFRWMTDFNTHFLTWIVDVGVGYTF